MAYLPRTYVYVDGFMVKERGDKVDQLAHQRLYIAALQALPDFELHKGAYIEKRVRRPLVAGQDGWSPSWPNAASEAEPCPVPESAARQRKVRSASAGRREGVPVPERCSNTVGADGHQAEQLVVRP